MYDMVCSFKKSSRWCTLLKTEKLFHFTTQNHLKTSLAQTSNSAHKSHSQSNVAANEIPLYTPTSVS